MPVWMLPAQMHNHGNYVVSLGNVCRWLAEQAEALGAEIYPGFAAAEVLYHEDGRVKGVATGDLGVARDGSHKDSYQPGMELHGRYTFFGEGCRGSLTRQLERSEEHTSELQSLMRISYAVFCLKKKKEK